MTQQQQEPNILAPSVQQAWDIWCDARIRDITGPIIGDTNEAFDVLGGETAKQFDDLVLELREVFGQERRQILELLEIVQVLAVGNDFLSGRIDQIKREFKHQNKKLGKAKQGDAQDEDDFMEQCISNLEDQGVDDAENVCAALWEEQEEMRTMIEQQRTSKVQQVVRVIDEILAH